jgi:hypothetical protein
VLVNRALDSAEIAGTFRSARERGCICLAVGKAARGMAAAAARRLGRRVRDGLITTNPEWTA